MPRSRATMTEPEPEPLLVEPLSYEAATARLEAIIKRLDSGEAGLRETLELCREGRPLAAGDRKERLLELVARQRAADAMFDEHGAQELRAAAPVGAGEHVVDRAGVEDAGHLGAVERALDLAPRPVLGDIQQRARERGAGDPVDDGDILLGDRHAAVRTDPGQGPTASAPGG